MLLLKSNKSLLILLLIFLVTGRLAAQDVIGQVKMEKLGTYLYRVHYTINQPAEYAFNAVTIKVFRKRGDEIKEISSETIRPRGSGLLSKQSYTWQTNAATLRSGDELQARVTINYSEKPVAKSRTEPASNMAPVANAGKFAELQLPLHAPVMLNGSNSFDSDGKIVAVEWKQIEGPAGLIILNPDSLITRVEGISKDGRYAFELTVKDEFGKTSMDRTVITIKPLIASAILVNPANADISPKKDNASVKKDTVKIVKPNPAMASAKLKGGPSNAFINLLLPGVGHYFVSGDHHGKGRKPATFIITALYAGSIGGGIYFKMKSDNEYDKYLELSNYREYQRDDLGNIIGVRGADQSKSSGYFDKAKASRRNAFILAGAGAGILVTDFVLTYRKGMKNKLNWKKEKAGQANIFIVPDGNGLTAGIRLKF